MVDPERLTTDCLTNCKWDIGAFYGPANELSLGAGLIYSDVLYPLFNEDTGLFETASGMVLVLTHECDVDVENVRHLNEFLVCCPITPFPIFADELEQSGQVDDLPD